MMKSNSIHPSRSTTTGMRPGLCLVLGVVGLGTLCVPPAARAQGPARLNKVIEAIEDGRPAVANQEWRFVDMEHSPFSGALVQSVLAEMDEDRDADGRMRLTPLVRIPQEGDEDFKWAVKQVLDIGGFGVILPHVDTKAEAVRFIQAMRYPPQQSSTAPAEPRGERGWGPWRGDAPVGNGWRRVRGEGRRLAAEPERRAVRCRHDRVTGGGRQHPRDSRGARQRDHGHPG